MSHNPIEFINELKDGGARVLTVKFEDRVEYFITLTPTQVWTVRLEEACELFDKWSTTVQDLHLTLYMDKV